MTPRSIQALLAFTLLGQGCMDAGERLDISKYHGSARVWEDPEGNYHKPWLIFPEVRLDQPGEHEFTIKGLPHSGFGYWVGLALPSMGSDSHAEYLSRLGIRCDIELRAIGSDAPLQLGGVLDGLSVSQTEDHRARGDYWANDSLWLEGTRRRIYVPRQLGHSHLFFPEQHTEYRLRISVSCTPRESADPTPVDARVTPVIWGSQDW